MEKGKITLHPGAVNLARRYTEMNENDLLMVSSLLESEKIALSAAADLLGALPTLPTHQPSLLCPNLPTTGEPLWYVKMRRTNFFIYLTCSPPMLTQDFFDRGQLARWQKDVHQAGLCRIGQAFDA